MSLFANVSLAARRVIAPVARPLWRRIYPRAMRVADVFRLSAAWHQLAPALMNAVTSVGALSREQARMKREYDASIAELKAAVAQLRESSAPAAGGVRLNIGGAPRGGYLTVARQPGQGVDVVAPLDALPFGAGEVGEIVVQSQGLAADELQQRLVPHWMTLLKPGGTLRILK